MTPARAVASAARVTAAIVVVLAFHGCGDDSDDEAAKSAPVRGTFVGTLAGTDAYVAVVAGKQNVVAYVCDGEHAIGQLFTGRRSGNAFRAGSGRARIALDLADDDRALGTVRLPGAQPRSFRANRAQGEAGLYRKVTRLNGRETRFAWVVLQDGSQRGSVVAGTTVAAAPPLKPTSGSFTLVGRTLTATRISPGGANAGLQFQGGGQVQGG